MKVLVLGKATERSEAGEFGSGEDFAAMDSYSRQLAEAGILLASDGLQPSSLGKRVVFDADGAATVIDGPFAETKELVAGFWLWQVRSMDEAIEWVKRCPNPMFTDSEIEIRQVVEAEDFGPEFTAGMREQEAKLRAHLDKK